MNEPPTGPDTSALKPGIDKIIAAAGVVIIGFLVYILLANRGAIFSRPTRYNVPADMFYLPQGDAVAGRLVLMQMRCTHCHAVEGDAFDPPVADPPVPVVLGPALADQPPWRVAESIIAPNHRVADGPDVTSLGLSRMGDFGGIMTVEQLTDLVAYLRSLAGSPPA